jgi:hypothetical protein
MSACQPSMSSTRKTPERTAYGLLLPEEAARREAARREAARREAARREAARREAARAAAEAA